MADSKISALTTKTTFGDNDFLAGTQGTGAGDNRKYGKAALKDAAGLPVRYKAYLKFDSTGLLNSRVFINDFDFTPSWTRGNVGLYNAQFPVVPNSNQLFVQATLSHDAGGLAPTDRLVVAFPFTAANSSVALTSTNLSGVLTDDLQVMVNIEWYAV